MISNSNQYDAISDDEMSGFTNSTKFLTTKFLTTNFLTTKFLPPVKLSRSQLYRRDSFTESAVSFHLNLKNNLKKHKIVFKKSHSAGTPWRRILCFLVPLQDLPSMWFESTYMQRITHHVKINSLTTLTSQSSRQKPTSEWQKLGRKNFQIPRVKLSFLVSEEKDQKVSELFVEFLCKFRGFWSNQSTKTYLVKWLRQENSHLFRRRLVNNTNLDSPEIYFQWIFRTVNNCQNLDNIFLEGQPIISGTYW